MFLLFIINLVEVVSSNSDLKIFSQCRTNLTYVRDITKMIPKDVVEIELAHNKITRIHREDFEKFTQCQKLDLRGNQIHTLETEAFKGLDSLKELNLMGNRITAFPNLTDLPRLTIISLQDNQIRSLMSSLIHVSPHNVIEIVISLFSSVILHSSGQSSQYR